MEMTKIKWDESMAARCLGRLKDQYPAVKPVAPINKPLPKVKYWDEFRNAIDCASRN